jgi:hypothetical protein
MLQLYLWHVFYNIIFEIEHKLYIAQGQPPQWKILGAHLDYTTLPALMIDVPPDIQSMCLPNTSQKRYFVTKLAQSLADQNP